MKYLKILVLLACLTALVAAQRTVVSRSVVQRGRANRNPVPRNTVLPTPPPSTTTWINFATDSYGPYPLTGITHHLTYHRYHIPAYASASALVTQIRSDYTTEVNAGRIFAFGIFFTWPGVTTDFSAVPSTIVSGTRYFNENDASYASVIHTIVSGALAGMDLSKVAFVDARINAAYGEGSWYPSGWPSNYQMTSGNIQSLAATYLSDFSGHLLALSDNETTTRYICGQRSNCGWRRDSWSAQQSVVGETTLTGLSPSYIAYLKSVASSTGWAVAEAYGEVGPGFTTQASSDISALGFTYLEDGNLSNTSGYSPTLITQLDSTYNADKTAWPLLASS